MDRFFASKSASSGSAAEPARQLSSIGDVQRWLTTLTDQTSSAESKRIKAAVDVLIVRKPKKEDVRPLCGTWFDLRGWTTI